jgi:ubiquinone/menaquinone biosynthesis C-methylase UbiE
VTSGNLDYRGGKGVEMQRQALQVIRKVGVRGCQKVLDFGCGSGTYTIPAAKTVGDCGRVYALDKDDETLNELQKRADSEGLTNIELMHTPGGTEIALATESVDVVLLFDVFHDYYFPTLGERQNLLSEIYRILKSDGFLSIYPKHMEAVARSEIESTRFKLEDEYEVSFIHDGKDLERGRILNFKKK